MALNMRRTSLIVIAVCLGFLSCRKEMERPSWDTEILAPLVNASLNINNLLPDSILQANPDSSLKIVYQNDIYNLTMDTLFNIPDTTIHNAYASPIASATLFPGDIVVNNASSETTYQLPGVELRKVIIKSGHVNYSITSLVHEVTKFIYSIPCATSASGDAFMIDVDVPAAVGSTPGVYNQTFDLSGYTIDLTGINNDKVNTIYTSLTAKIHPLGSPVIVTNNDSLVINNTFGDIIPYYALGYFGQNTFDIGPDVSEFTLFNRIIDGTLQLEDVTFDLKLQNSIGMDSRVNIFNISSINNRTGNTINLVNSVIGSTININRASQSGTTVYPTYANFPLTTSNSNIKPMIENLPDQFGYSLKIQTNPLGNVSGSNDFIYSDKLFKAQFNMEIPLSLVATNLTLADTLDMNISSGEGEQNIHSAVLTLFADNGFPFDAQLQLYMLDDNNVITDSIFGYANTIDEAPLNSSLRAIGKKLTKIMVPVDENKMTRLYNTHRVLLKVKFNTSSQPSYVKIYSDYSIDVRIVGDINYTVQLH